MKRPWHDLDTRLYSGTVKCKVPRHNLSAWQEAEAAGLDMSLVEANLRKTTIERIRAHDRALKLAVELRKAVERKRHRAAT